MTQGPFASQQKDLVDAFEVLKNSVRSKIEKIEASAFSEKDTKSFRQDLDKQIEHLHLMVSSYFGDCDNRKQQIEAVISEKVDVSDFMEIGKQILT